MAVKRTIETNITEEDIKIEGSLRPQTLSDYIGQASRWISSTNSRSPSSRPFKMAAISPGFSMAGPLVTFR